MQSVTRAPGKALEAPSGRFPLGTDQFGRPLLGLLIWGARISLTVGLLAAVLSVAIGTLVGILAGHYGGWAATVTMRITDWFLVMPTLVLAIVLATVMSRSIWTVIVAIGVTSWPTTARLVRAQTIAVESRPYIERARALGGGHGHIMSRHVLPNVMPLVLAQTTLGISSAILTEATLAFLGLGDPTIVSWGGMLQDAREAGAVSSGHWWYLAPPDSRSRSSRWRSRSAAVRSSPCSTRSWGCPVERNDGNDRCERRDRRVRHIWHIWHFWNVWNVEPAGDQEPVRDLRLGGVGRARRTGRRSDPRAGTEARCRRGVGMRQVHPGTGAAQTAAAVGEADRRDPARRRGRPHHEVG